VECTGGFCRQLSKCFFTAVSSVAKAA